MKFRKAKKSDLNFLHEIRGETLEEMHLERLEYQKNKLLDYYIAFLKNKPIGYVMITYKNFHSWHKFPAIEDLYVKESEREKGFAKKIILYVEEVIKKKGFIKSCLDVETHEKWIRKFYESLGYKKISGVHDLKYVVKNTPHLEKVNYFEKTL